MDLQLCIPCLFGLEGLVGNELRHMNMQNVAPENGRVYFQTDEYGLARANVRSRFGERVLLVMGQFPADSFDALFEGVKALPWETYIPKNGAFPVKGYSLDSTLHSVPDCQKIVKKAVADRLGNVYHVNWLPEDGAVYQIQFAIMKDQAVLYLDTTGEGLFKRGYRPAHGTAPLRETLAAAMVDIAGYRGKGDFCDPFCGSGTIAIEAALSAKNRAPGIRRHFSSQNWDCFDPGIWRLAVEEARSREFSRTYHIFASDIDPKALSLARENAKRAGVEDCIEFSQADATQFSRSTDRGMIVTNPPYGDRLMEKREAEALYTAFGNAFRQVSGWQLYLLSSHTEFERAFGQPAVKKRKLYNGTIKCDLFMYR